MNVQSIRPTPAQDARTAVQPIATKDDLTPARDASEPRAFRLRGGSMPQLTGEIRSLVYIRLREVSLLVTVGWSFVLLLCLSGLDGLFNSSRLGIRCIGAMMVTTVVFLVCGILLRVGVRYSLAWLRGFEAVYLWGSVVCAAWLRHAALGYALDQETPDRFMVLYGSSFSDLIWMAVLVIYGIFAPNTWRRLLMMMAGIVAVLVGVEVATWTGRPAAQHDLLISNLLITVMTVFLGVGTAVYGSFKLSAAREEAASAQRQLRELGLYRLKRRLGAGAMGEVYLAEHTLLRRPCAVKLIRPSGPDEERQVARFEREVRATATLTHPNTVEIYDYELLSWSWPGAALRCGLNPVAPAMWCWIRRRSGMAGFSASRKAGPRRERAPSRLWWSCGATREPIAGSLTGRLSVSKA